MLLSLCVLLVVMTHSTGSICPSLPDTYPCDCIDHTNVVAINCSHRFLTHIPDLSLFKRVNILWIQLDHNRISSIPDRGFDELQLNNNHLSAPAVIDISNNPIVSLPPSAFDGIRADDQLALRLVNCSLHDIPREALSGFVSLTQLYLDKNNIPVLQNNAFQGLPKLRFLSLDSNPIGQIQIHAFDGLDDVMQHLNLGHTHLTYIPMPSLRRLNALEVLIFDGSPIMTFPEGFSILEGSGNLKVLSFKDCGLTSIHRNAFSTALYGLDVINLQNNSLTQVDFYTEMIVSDGAFTTVDVTDNAIVCDCHLVEVLDTQTDNRNLVGVCPVRSASYTGMDFAQFVNAAKQDCMSLEGIESQDDTTDCKGDKCTNAAAIHAALSISIMVTLMSIINQTFL